jgi:glycosyltransferase involved in cell wall biosynthesis
MESICVGNELLRAGRYAEAAEAYRRLIGGPSAIAEIARANLELLKRRQAAEVVAAPGARPANAPAQVPAAGGVSSHVSLAQIYDEIRVKATSGAFAGPGEAPPLISIIVTAHDTEQYLDACIESLVSQTYPNKEIVIVDDFSSDATPQIARRLVSTYREVRYRRLNSNLGTYYAKNLGIAMSKGEYMFFQDSDDISHPLRIEILLGELRQSGRRVVRGSYCRVDPYTDQVLAVNGLVSKLGLITLGVERKVFDEIGFFNCTTKASDDEFFHRVVRFLGKGAVVDNKLPLYQSTYREGSLFADMVSRRPDGSIEQTVSASRAHYVGSFTRVHEANTSDSIGAVFLFPRIRDAVEVLSDMTKLPNPGERVIYNVCSIPSREAALAKTVASIIDQCDELHVYLDKYARVPAFLTALGAKCKVVMSQDRPGLRDNGKFLHLEELVRRGEQAFYFTIDDDIVYPPDYTNAMLARLKRYRNRCAVGVHGVLMRDKPAGYFSDRRIVYSFTKALETERAVNVLGTGTLAFHTGIFDRFSLDEFASAGMVDLYFAVKCKREQVPMITVSRFEGWLVDINPEPAASLYHEFKGADDRQAELVRASAPWGLLQIGATIDRLAGVDPLVAEALRATMLPLRSLTRHAFETPAESRPAHP